MGLGLKAVTETSLPCEQDLCAEHALWASMSAMEEEATAGSATLKPCSSHSAGMGD